MKLKNDNLFFIGFLLLQISSTFLTVDTVSEYTKYIKLFSIIIFIFCSIEKIINTRIKSKYLFIYIFMILLGIVSCIITNDYFLLSLVLALVCSINIEFSKIIKYDFIIKIIIFLSLVILSYVGLTNERVFYRDMTIRYTFGFVHPNTFALYVMVIYFEYFYLYLEKNNKNPVIKRLIIGLILILFIDRFVDSRSAEICIIIFNVTLLFTKYFYRIFDSLFIKNMYYVLLIISLLSTFLFINNNEFVNNLNSVLSNRILFQSIYYKEYGLTLFGTITQLSYALDNVYMKLIIKYGIICSFVIGYIYNINIRSAFLKKDALILAIFISMLFYGLMENSIFDISMFPFILYFGNTIRVGDENE